MAFYTCIFRCTDGRYYTGHTDDLQKHAGMRHQGSISGGYTCNRRPLERVWHQEFPTPYQAFAAER